ncbi:hypothetical protein V5O48_008766 [Marasmius crinis-equi]|uniref:DUF6534 domain-containing protein n=1 Tax=Marasmius crinis-equi TaxID=585013 RepID=A0ABR3FD47_9AGAR
MLMLHHYFVQNFGNISEFTVIVPELSTFTLLTLIIIIICDLSFASRVWRLNRLHWSIPTAITATALGALGISLVNGIFRAGSVADLNSTTRKSRSSIYLQLSPNVCRLSHCGGAFAIMKENRQGTYALYGLDEASFLTLKLRSAPPSFLQRMRVFLVNRGVLLTVNQLLTAFTFFYHPEKLYWAPFHQMLGPLYYITMLATLNARNKIRQTKELQLQSQTNVFGASTYHGENDLPVHPFIRRRQNSRITPFTLPVEQNHRPVVPPKAMMNVSSVAGHLPRNIKETKEKAGEWRKAEALEVKRKRSGDGVTKQVKQDVDSDSSARSKGQATATTQPRDGPSRLPLEQHVQPFFTTTQQEVPDVARPHPSFLVVNRVDSDKQSTSSAGYYDPYTGSETGSTRGEVTTDTSSDYAGYRYDSRSTLLNTTTDPTPPLPAPSDLMLSPLRHAQPAPQEAFMSRSEAPIPRKLPTIPSRLHPS